MLSFLLPLLLSNILQALGQTANQIYLGHLVGVRALAAVSAIFPIIFFLISFLIGLGSGSTALIGQAYGAREFDKLKAVAGTTLALALGLGTLVGAAGFFLAEPILRAMGTPGDIFAISLGYAKIVFAGMPLLFVYLIYTTFLRGTGDAQTPFWALVATTVVTMAISPVLIIGLFGVPRLETDGAAAGNLGATFLGLIGLLVYLARSRHPLALDRAMRANLKLQWPIVRRIVQIGVPTAINTVMVSLAEIAVLAFVNRYGSRATAAYGAVNQVASYVQFPAVSIAIATSIFGSQAIGAGRQERLSKIVRSAVALNYAIEGTLILAGYLLATGLISLFVTDAPTVEIAHRLLMITLWSYAIFGNARILSGLMIASGTVVWPTFISVFSIWGIEVPVAYVAMGAIGLAGVWFGYPASFAVGLLLQYLYYRFVWSRRRIERLI
ncbi:MAG: MATE family efflux transporter [Vulcanimicrobiaceae bacterium]